MPKLLIIGVDGGTLDLISPLADSGRLPNLARLMGDGAYGTLLSTIPPITAPAWVSFMTGKGPGKHGVFDFVAYRAGVSRADSRIHSARSIATTTLWQILSDHGRQLVVVNVPLTYPPSPVNGVMLSGLLVPGPRATFTSPPEVKDELERNGVGFAPDWNVRGTHAPIGSGKRRWLEAFQEAERKRHQGALYLLRTHPWDCAAIVYTLTDRAQHLYWASRDCGNGGEPPTEITSAYQSVDAMIGELRAAAPADTTVLVLSDHGFGSVRRSFSTSAFLSALGLLSVGAQRRRWGRARYPVAGLLSRLGMGGLVPALPTWMRNSRISMLLPRRQREIDWARTKAYPARWGICLNLIGREQHGTVAPGREYEELRDRLIAELRGLPDPLTGEMALASAWRREEVYRGPFVEQAPDIVFRMAAPDCLQSDQLGQADLFFERSTGTHRLDGVFVLSGPQVSPGPAPTASIIDLAPTILHLSGCPVPDSMEGRVMTQCFRPEWLGRFPVRYQRESSEATRITDSSPYTDEEEDRLKDHLRALGYL
jgi:predicted AlkP superfamily phosphohydrolase/phosphomutase